jgi:hypothetical protein
MRELSDDDVRLDTWPEEGRIVVAHPDNERYAWALAWRHKWDYFLSPFAPKDQIFVVDSEKMYEDMVYASRPIER